MNEAETRDWRQKYADVVRTFEAEELQYREQQQSLRKLLGRLCLLARGQSPLIDAELQKLRDLIAQKQSSSRELDSIGSAITQAIHELEHPPTRTLPAAANTEAPGDCPAPTAQIRDTLSRLLQELRRDPQLATSAEALLEELAQQGDPQLWPSLLDRLGGMFLQRIRNLETARKDLEALLDHLVTSLDQMAQFASGDAEHLVEQARRRDDFSTQVEGEVQALTQTIESNGNLSELRQLLRARLDSIGSRLQAFRQREAEVLSEARVRSEQMHGRIAELESRACELQERLVQEKRAASLDPLTQIPNRLAWDQRIAEELERWQRFAQPTCVATWDVDHFKQINDNYGHAAGDKVLKIVAECLANSLRSVDFIARYGGEEFVMILPGSTLEQAMDVADRIREAVAKLGFHVSGKPLRITISCGVSALREGDTAASAFERADQALYRAKAEGRNRVVST